MNVSNRITIQTLKNKKKIIIKQTLDAKVSVKRKTVQLSAKAEIKYKLKEIKT